MEIVQIEGEAYIESVAQLLSMAHPNYPLTVDDREYKRFNDDMFRICLRLRDDFSESPRIYRRKV